MIEFGLGENRWVLTYLSFHSHCFTYFDKCIRRSWDIFMLIALSIFGINQDFFGPKVCRLAITIDPQKAD